MMPWFAILGLLLVAAASRVQAQTAEDARAAMQRATSYFRSLAMSGGYLWWYSVDLKERGGENKATRTQIWVQPPGTPEVGMAFIRAWRATGDTQYLEAARAAGLALVTGQLESGGWDYLIDFDPEQAKRWFRRTDIGKITSEEAARRRNVTVFDDDTTQSALRFLLELAHDTKSSEETRDRQIRKALEYGLAKMIEAQYPNGAWPQRYDGRRRDPAEFPVKRATIPENWSRTQPHRHKYATFYTFNDHTIRDCILTMLKAHALFGDSKYLESAKRGGEFIVLAQLPEPQAGWAQQYNSNMEPDWARAFEPPAVSASESGAIIRVLMELYVETGDEQFLKPVPAALEWLSRSQIAPNRWARYYELGTNKPIYGDRDGKIHYTLEEISEERRKGYGWQGEFGIQSVIRFWEQVQSDGRQALIERQGRKPLTTSDKRARAKTLAPAVVEAMESLHAEGRWISRNRIESRTFVRNLDILSEFAGLSF